MCQHLFFRRPTRPQQRDLKRLLNGSNQIPLNTKSLSAKKEQGVVTPVTDMTHREKKDGASNHGFNTKRWCQNLPGEVSSALHDITKGWSDSNPTMPGGFTGWFLFKEEHLVWFWNFDFTQLDLLMRWNTNLCQQGAGGWTIEMPLQLKRLARLFFCNQQWPLFRTDRKLRLSSYAFTQSRLIEPLLFLPVEVGSHKHFLLQEVGCSAPVAPSLRFNSIRLHFNNLVLLKRLSCSSWSTELGLRLACDSCDSSINNSLAAARESPHRSSPQTVAEHFLLWNNRYDRGSFTSCEPPL